MREAGEQAMARSKKKEKRRSVCASAHTERLFPALTRFSLSRTHTHTHTHHVRVAGVKGGSGHGVVGVLYDALRDKRQKSARRVRERNTLSPLLSLSHLVLQARFSHPFSHEASHYLHPPHPPAPEPGPAGRQQRSSRGGGQFAAAALRRLRDFSRRVLVLLNRRPARRRVRAGASAGEHGKEDGIACAAWCARPSRAPGPTDRGHHQPPRFFFFSLPLAPTSSFLNHSLALPFPSSGNHPTPTRLEGRLRGMAGRCA